jgi:hypothetical protein
MKYSSSTYTKGIKTSICNGKLEKINKGHSIKTILLRKLWSKKWREKLRP